MASFYADTQNHRQRPATISKSSPSLKLTTIWKSIVYVLKQKKFVYIKPKFILKHTTITPKFKPTSVFRCDYNNNIKVFIGQSNARQKPSTMRQKKYSHLLYFNLYNNNMTPCVLYTHVQPSTNQIYCRIYTSHRVTVT